MEICNFELAKKLKEKGFREECLYHYPNCGEDYAEANYIHGDDRFDINTDYLYQCNNNDSYLIDAPTIPQTLKWLREKHSIHISTKPYNCEDGTMWLYEIRKFTKCIIFVIANRTGFVKEEQAALAGIEYIIDILL